MGAIVPQVVSEDRASGALIVDGGLRFDSGKTHYLSRTPSSDGNRKTWTWSGWVKRSGIGAQNYDLFDANQDQNFHNLYFNSSGALVLEDYNVSILRTNALHRDPSSWYHIVAVYDSTSATSADRIILYVNGIRQSTAAYTAPTQNTDGKINGTSEHRIGRFGYSTFNNYFDGHLSNVYFIDGQALGPEYFGYTDPLTNTWRPKKFKPQATPNDGTVWSTNSTLTNAANAFDGSFSSSATIDTTVRTLTTETITVNNKLEIYTNNYNLQTITLNINGQNYVNINDASSEWTTVPFTGIMSGTTTIVRSAGSAALYAVRVDGVTLINSDTANIGLNGFHLPFDGSALIGQDQSGRGNNWTPVNFGGSNTLEKATGALPILNTDGGGKVARVGVRTDANASSLVLALPLVGIKSDFSNAINSGTSNKTITANGNAAASSSQSNFYGGSFYFDGTGDYLDTPDSADYTFGTGNFTCEMWVYPSNASDTDRFLGQINSGGNTTNMSFRMGRNSGTFICGVAEGSTDYTITGQSVPANKWTHLALVRDGNTLRAFQDGVQTGTVSFSGTVNDSSNKLAIGRLGESDGSYFTGYINDVRIYKGVAKYTSNFIPASTDPDIVPDSPSGVSYSSNLALVPSTDGAVAFDGSGDYLSLTDTNNDLDLGGLQASVEFFVYVTDLSATRVILNKGGGASGSPWNTSDGLEWTFVYVSGGAFYFQYNNAGSTGSITASLSLGVWTHVAAATDASNNISLFINGIRIGTATNAVTKPSSRTLIRIGQDWVSQTHSGHISNVHFIKGNGAYNPTATTITVPTAPISSVENTKLLCCKSNSSATAADVTPGTITANGNAAASNFNPFTANINTQRGKQSGYATLNPLDKPSSSSVTLSNGNLRAADGNSGYYSLVVSNIGFTTSNTDTGYYLEVLNVNGTNVAGNSGYTGFSFWYPQGGSYNNSYRPGTATYNPNNGYSYGTNGTVASWGTNISSQPTWGTAGDIFSVAVKGSNVWFAKNGVWISGNPASNTSPFTTIPAGYSQVFPAYLGLETGTLEFNFGQKPFKFPPPAGFQPLTLANLPRPTIVRPDQYVGVTTYTGDNAATRNVGNLLFKPDFVWIKNRDTTNNHQLYDVLRTSGSDYCWLGSNSTSAESCGSSNTFGYVSDFINDGVEVTRGSSSGANLNETGNDYVMWAWKAGGNSNTFNIDDVGYDTASAAGLTAGTITPTGASVGTKSGFSIIKWNGSGSSGTLSHRLGKTPGLIFLKGTSAGEDGQNWRTYHSALGTSPSNTLFINLINTPSSNTERISAVGTDTFTLSSGGAGVNASGQSYIAYLWAEIPGFSKFGSYTGNGSGNVAVDGPVIQCGFRPAFILIKCTTQTQNWYLADSTRNPFNSTSVNTKALFPNSSATERDAEAAIDFLSNGFKLRHGEGAVNDSGATYIYAAFAEAPTFNLYGAQANAR